MFRQPALGIHRRGATFAGSGNRLPIDVIGDVAGGEHPGKVRKGAFPLDKVAVLVHFEFVTKGRCIGDVTDGDEDAFDLKFALRA